MNEIFYILERKFAQLQNTPPPKKTSKPIRRIFGQVKQWIKYAIDCLILNLRGEGAANSIYNMNRGMHRFE